MDEISWTMNAPRSDDDGFDGNDDHSDDEDDDNAGVDDVDESDGDLPRVYPGRKSWHRAGTVAAAVNRTLMKTKQTLWIMFIKFEVIDF